MAPMIESRELRELIVERESRSADGSPASLYRSRRPVVGESASKRRALQRRLAAALLVVCALILVVQVVLLSAGRREAVASLPGVVAALMSAFGARIAVHELRSVEELLDVQSLTRSLEEKLTALAPNDSDDRSDLIDSSSDETADPAEALPALIRTTAKAARERELAS